MAPDAWQARVLRSTAPRLHLNCSRQVGKSTVTSILALHKALYTPGATILIISPTDRQSSELFLKIAAFYKTLGQPVEPEQETVHALRLENNARILSLPASESGIRGFTASLILIDEAAYVPDSLYTSVSPMLAVSGGRLVAMSTPAGRRGWWWVASAAAGWEHLEVPAKDCPRITAEFLEEERERLGEVAFMAEYCCQFVDAAGAAFSGDDITALFAYDRTLVPPIAAQPRPKPSPGAVVVARHVQAMERRKLAAQVMRGRDQRRCPHLWRGGSCVHCALTKENWYELLRLTGPASLSGRGPGAATGPNSPGGRGLLPGRAG